MLYISWNVTNSIGGRTNIADIEVDGTIATDNGAKMIDELNLVCDKLKVAGTFAPHAEI